MHDPEFACQMSDMLVASMKGEASDIHELLEERSLICNRHGTFADAAATTENIKRAMRNRDKRTDSMNYALDQIAGKMGRIDQGDPSYADHWRDIAGYATLVANELARGVK